MSEGESPGACALGAGRPGERARRNPAARREHGGDPKSIAFCHRLGLDYVSCSPYRVPVARLAAAQAEIADTQEKNGWARNFPLLPLRHEARWRVRAATACKVSPFQESSDE
jgi:hypothetical protein